MRLLSALAVAGLTSCAPVEAPPAMPPMTLVDLAGGYDASPAACAGPGSDMRLTIAADRVMFHESSCRVLSQEAAAGGVQAQLACTGEGETWSDSRDFTPTHNGVIVTTGGQSTPRIRCN
ncbi:hypothetical protein GI374_09210 [Paracoccus sp. S-4012]|uniref:hypothetical protein n=1 Tax=Paracoccus sp. S-4012 TaxID=2665648 RepID=UPI0012B07D08|nr:hypothetical protein [Paracoccus sp. S-4012]MRX50621.1 hypothetical protein [Paracoccus sp. S-4012]